MAVKMRKKEEGEKTPEQVRQEQLAARLVNPASITLGLLVTAVGVILGILLDLSGVVSDGIIAFIVALSVLAGFYLMFALKIADQWEKAVMLHFGKFAGLKGPGLFWIVPIVDRVTTWVDHRVIVTPFNAERTLTRDTVPVDIDAVLFWMVWDAEKAALEVEDYRVAVSWAAQTALRDIIGKMMLADILVGREKIDEELQKLIDARTAPWGITVQSVEVRDVIIPQELEDAMSRQAQAERERQARIILGESEEQIATSFRRASASYADNPTALHLRAMNMLFEGLKERGAMIIVPSSAVDTMNLGGLLGMASLQGMVSGGEVRPPGQESRGAPE
jgi:regulator of protease activity HflC (stomatin/prohibitin superfamily)